jgi:hypothetical protein
MRAALIALLCVACGDNVVPDAPKLKITAGDALRTTEGGGTAMFSIGFEVPPSSPMTLQLSTTNSAEGTVTPASIMLRANDVEGQLVTVTGVDDDELDGDIAYRVHIDAGMMGQHDIALTNEDDEDERGGAMVTAASTTTTEAGGTATFSVVLTQAPLAHVTIPVASSNPAEGAASIAQLEFDTENWNVPQIVTVTGANDDVDDGDQPYMVILAPATSSDPHFSGMNPGDVSLTNIDDDAAGVAVSAISGTTSEAGASATFTIVLASEPIADVTIMLSSSDTSEGDVTPTAITFTPNDWDTARTLTVLGADDVIDDGDIAYTIVTAAATSLDAHYMGFDAADVTVTNLDNDGAGIDVTPPAGGLVTNENGDSDAFSIVLRTQPTGDVTIPIASTDVSEGVTIVASVTFTMLDWNIPRDVFVTGQDDAVADGTIAYSVVVGPATSSDPAYDAIDPPDVAATNLDNDTARILVFPTDGLFVSELGDLDAFQIVLAQAPLASVTIPLASNDTTEGTLFPTFVTSVTFNAFNWFIPQTVQVRGVDDPDPDGNIAFSIVTGAALSFDPAYSGVDAQDVLVRNFDNETANVFVQARKTLSTSETGGPSGSASFRVRLTTTPTGPVTCTLASNDLTEGQVVPQTLVFNNTSFQTVTVVGLDDTIVDGDVPYRIITAPCTSTDPDYDERNPRDVPVTNRDND